MGNTQDLSTYTFIRLKYQTNHLDKVLLSGETTRESFGKLIVDKVEKSTRIQGDLLVGI
jgi:hypothetical protein